MRTSNGFRYSTANARVIFASLVTAGLPGTRDRRTAIRRRSLAAALLAAGTLVVAWVSATEAALTTPSCLAKKLKEWGTLRKCLATENGKALQGKAADPAKCQTKFDEKLAKLADQVTAAAIACRYGLNGDGTATDYDTGLQWEQKTDDGSVHDKNNTYTWNTAMVGTTPDGTAFTAFLGTLNNGTSLDAIATTGCFAGHCDWRLPAIGELTGILDTTQGNCGGGSGPCISQAIFGPTVASFYWAATTAGGGARFAWYVDFLNGRGPLADRKDLGFYVRGVRSAL